MLAISCHEMKGTQQLRKLFNVQPGNINEALLTSVRRKYYIFLILTLVILAGYQVKSQNNSSYKTNGTDNEFDLVDKNGIIRKPSDYRDRGE